MEIKKILVTFDGSKHSEKGLDIAISLVKESKRSIVGLFVKPHSVESLRYGDVFSEHQDEIMRKTFQTLRERLFNRHKGQENLIEQRMNKFNEEISHWDEYDYVIVNDDLPIWSTVNIVFSRRS